MAGPARSDDRPEACPACGAALGGRYCHDCGQDTHARPRPLREFAAEAFSETNLVDGRTAHTLVALAIRPGRMLEAYRAGAGSQYQSLVKLFVVATALFLLTLNFADVAIYQYVAQPQDPSRPVTAAADPDGVTIHLNNVIEQDRWMQRRVEPPVAPAVTQAIIDAAARAPTEKDRQNLLYENQSNREQTIISERMAAWMPNALWLLMPLYALLLAPFFGRKRLLMEHLNFAMWAHVTGFILLILLALLNRAGLSLPVWAVIVPYLAYVTRAAARYYQLRWPQALWRAAAHLTLYFVVVLCPASLLVALSALDLEALAAYSAVA